SGALNYGDGSNPRLVNIVDAAFEKELKVSRPAHVSFSRRFRHNVHLQLRIGRGDVARLEAEFLADDVAALGDGGGLVEGDLAVAALPAESAVAPAAELVRVDVLERAADAVGDLVGAIGLERAVAHRADAEFLGQLALVRAEQLDVLEVPVF